MPFINIQSLPFSPEKDIPAILKNISHDFSIKTRIEEEHITAIWSFFSPHHYSVAGQTTAYQLKKSHPILVDLLIPDFHTGETIKNMLPILATSIAKHTGILLENVFIHVRKAKAGHVFDAGEVVGW